MNLANILQGGSSGIGDKLLLLQVYESLFSDPILQC